MTIDLLEINYLSVSIAFIYSSLILPQLWMANRHCSHSLMVVQWMAECLWLVALLVLSVGSQGMSHDPDQWICCMLEPV
jgi:hypothetical protein